MNNRRCLIINADALNAYILTSCWREDLDLTTHTGGDHVFGIKEGKILLPLLRRMIDRYGYQIIVYGNGRYFNTLKDRWEELKRNSNVWNDWKDITYFPLQIIEGNVGDALSALGDQAEPKKLEMIEVEKEKIETLKNRGLIVYQVNPMTYWLRMEARNGSDDHAMGYQRTVGDAKLINVIRKIIAQNEDQLDAELNKNSLGRIQVQLKNECQHYLNEKQQQDLKSALLFQTAMLIAYEAMGKDVSQRFSVARARIHPASMLDEFVTVHQLADSQYAPSDRDDPLSTKLYNEFQAVKALLIKRKISEKKLQEFSTNMMDVIQKQAVVELKELLEEKDSKKALQNCATHIQRGKTKEILEYNNMSKVEIGLKILSVMSILILVGLIPTAILMAKRYYDSAGASVNFFKPLTRNIEDDIVANTKQSSSIHNK